MAADVLHAGIMRLRARSFWASQNAESALDWVARTGQRRGVQTLVFLVLVVWAVASERWSHSEVPGLLAFAVLGTAPLLSLRRSPSASVAVILTANSVFILFARLAWPMANVFAWFITLVACPIVLSRRRAVFALIGTEAVVLGAAALVPAQLSTTPWDATIAEAVVALLAWMFGAQLLRRHRDAVAQAQAAAELRALHEADAVSRGRVGIARELHDVVAHHVSLIAVRAATARYSMPDLAPDAERVFDEIAEQARTALTELRTVLGVLRTPEVIPDQAPQPTLNEVAALIEQVRSAGNRVELSVSGERPVQESVQRCGYRIIQEALTNATRYAPGSIVRVELAYQPSALTVRVCDDGGSRPTPQPVGSGFGLIGMRERVGLVGGTLRTGPRGTGFAVEASLPLVASLAAAE